MTHIVCFLYLDELLLRVLVRVRVGMVLPRELGMTISMRLIVDGEL